MNSVLMRGCKFIEKYSYPILLTLFILWACYGIFPLQCYETDGQELTLGFDVMVQEGWSFPPVYSYEYQMQPLITILVVALKHLLPFFSCEQIYAVLTILFSLLFLFGCISFTQHITQVSKTWILVAAMLLPEMYAIAMYSNTAIPAAACFIWALVMMSRERYWVSFLLLCVAPLFRVDVVVVYPTVLPMLIFGGKSWKRALVLSAAYAVGVVSICLCIFWSLHADVLSTFSDYQDWNGIITVTERILAIVGFYSLAYFLLLPLGVGVIIAKRYWKELFIVLLPIVLQHIVLASFGNASKHFLYNAPFAIIAGVRALMWLKEILRTRPVLQWTTAVVLALYMTVSVRKGNVSMPWIYENPLSKAGVVVPLYETERAGTSYSLGLGAGFQLVTGDEYMLLTGHLFYSWYIHVIKQITGDWRRQQKAVIDTIPTSNILVFEYGAYDPISSEYLTEGYRFRQQKDMTEAYRFTLSDGQRDLHFFRVVLSKPITDKQEVADYIDGVSPGFLDGDAYIISAPNHYGASYFMDELVAVGRLEKKAERLYRIKK